MVMILVDDCDHRAALMAFVNELPSPYELQVPIALNSLKNLQYAHVLIFQALCMEESKKTEH